MKHLTKEFDIPTLTIMRDMIDASMGHDVEPGVPYGWRVVQGDELLPKFAKTKYVNGKKVVELKSLGEEKNLMMEMRRFLGHSEGEINLARNFRTNAYLTDVQLKHKINKTAYNYEAVKEDAIELILHMREVLRVSNKYGLGSMRYQTVNKNVNSIQGNKNTGNAVARVILNDLNMEEDLINFILSTEDIDSPANRVRLNNIVNEQKIKERDEKLEMEKKYKK